MKTNKPPRFLRGFKFALRGFVLCINNERNMRFHTAAMLYVLVFLPFFTLTKTQIALLLLTMSSVIAAEMLNTAAEELADLSSADYNPLARAAKDIAAGAVLVCAVFSVAVGVVLLWQPEAFLHMWQFFWGAPWLFLPLVLGSALICVYVAKGPPWIYRTCFLWIRNLKSRLKSKE